MATTITIFALSACGEDEEPATATDGAFLSAMVPHHRGAIEMAEVAQTEGQHPRVKRLARQIIATQESEIDQIDGIHERLYGEPTGEIDHGPLGLPAASMGMHNDMSMLTGADPFDRQFIDMMIPHHQGAIRMAQIELAEGDDEQTRSLAESIIDAQSAEIEEMNRWRRQWYGSASPAGGIPNDDETMGQMEAHSGSMPGMDH